MLKNDKWSLLHGPHIIFIFLAILCIYRILVSDLIPINWDGPLFIDGSYRVYLGHIPNKDFSVPIGPLIFLSGGLGMKLTTPSILGMNVGFVIYILVIALVLIYMLWPDLKRKVQVADILFFGVIFLLLLSPKVLGGKPYNLAYTGFYNNISYAILFATCYFLLASNACQDSKRNFLLGHVLGHLIFIKLIFFLATALICFLFLMTYRRKQLVTVSLGIVSTLAILIFIEGSLTFFIRDQLYVSYLRMSENPYFSGERLWNFFKHTWLEVLIFLVLLYSSRKKEAPILFTGLLLFFVEYFLSMAIMQKPVHMTSVLFAMLLLKYAPDTEDARTLIVRLKSNFLKILLIGKFLINSSLWIPYLAINFSMPTLNISDSKARTKNSILKYIHHWDFEKYVSHCKEECHEILVVGQNNIFNFYLGLKPEKGGLLYWQSGVTFSKDLSENSHLFSETDVFRGVDLVILAKGFHYPSSHAFLDIYKSYLLKYFELIIEDDGAIVYQRAH